MSKAATRKQRITLQFTTDARTMTRQWRSFPLKGYNADMATSAGSQIDAWLRDGGIVVTASDRTARALTAAYHRARRAEGLTAWPAPQVKDWKSFVRDAWSEIAGDGRLLLNAAQERSLWAGIAARDGHNATLLPESRHRIAALGMDGHDLLCSYAPRYLKPAARGGWQQDAAVFSQWLAAFDDACRGSDLLSASRIPLELIETLQRSGPSSRPPLMLAGFDRILPVQRRLFDAWGSWQSSQPDISAPAASYYEAADTQAELAACALWCAGRLRPDSHTRLLIVMQDVASLRGEMERALLQHAGPAGSPNFEFSLGIPLNQVPLARSAHLILRWLTGSLDESEVEWLLSTGHAAASAPETAELQRFLRELRRSDRQRPEWTLDAFCGESARGRQAPAAWTSRTREAQRHLRQSAERPRSPVEWAELAPQLLRDAGWPGFQPLTTNGFQTTSRWQQAVETCGSLGFDGRRIRWQEFLDALKRALDETLFTPESSDAPVQIAGPAESAGLSADAAWFLGVNEDTWPAGGAMHPLLPVHVQRETDMPHASPRQDWELAQAITSRLIASASEVCFSYARQNERAETRPSRLIAQVAGMPSPLPAESKKPASPAPATVRFEDTTFVPYAKGTAAGGARVLNLQTQCPFKAFAVARLGAEGWTAAEAGLTPAQRGQLVHAVLHAVWDKPNGLHTLGALRDLSDRRAFVATRVERVLRDQISAGARERMPQRYLELEGERLTGVVCEWLDYELARHPFTVAATEADSTVNIAGLTLRVRIDRIDELNDGSLLVIDYKTGAVSPKSWDPPRPDDVQLPLYASFALHPGAEIGGLAFAKVRAGTDNIEFSGRVRDAAGTLAPGLSATTGLVKEPLTAYLLAAWRERIERLARDFIAGRAEPDPREYPRTCESCGLQTLCRIHENRALSEVEDDVAAGE
jgi:ATP-dependent helicase/nuclease subunit B